MTYHVTVRDIVHGVPKSPEWCPVARAIRRRHATQKVWVGNTSIRIGYQLYAYPKRVAVFADRFDAGQAVRPMRFELI